MQNNNENEKKTVYSQRGTNVPTQPSVPKMPAPKPAPNSASNNSK